MPSQNFTLHQLGWRPQYAHASALADFQAGYPARVVAVQGNRAALLSSRGAGTAALGWPLAGVGIAPGDWVMVNRRSGRATDVLPRQSWLAHAPAGNAVAANLDTVFVLGRLEPRSDVPRLQRGLTLARAGGATPVLVLDDAGRGGDAHARLDALRRWLPAADAVVLDGAAPDALARLSPWLSPGCTVAFVGGASGLPERCVASGVRHGAMSVVGGVWVIDAPALRDPAVRAAPDDAQLPAKRVAG